MKTQKTMALPDALEHLQANGVRAEKIAVDLGLSFGLIKRWKDGTRKPKLATVKQIEHLYGVKIS